MIRPPSRARLVFALLTGLTLLASPARSQADPAPQPTSSVQEPLAVHQAKLVPMAGAVDHGADFELPDGLQAELWAESPQLFNPTAIDVDHRGRVWVAEAVNYRKWRGRNPGRDHPDGDRIVVLEDSNGDGRADRSTVFVQDRDLVAPLGIAVFGSRVVVSCSPDIFIYHDDDGDLVADRREVLLTGFGGRDHDHGVHSVTEGPDGGWLLAVGNAGPHLVTDSDGWRLRSGSLYNGGGPTTVDNRPGLVSDDGQVWVGGLVLGLRPDGGGLTVQSHNYRNNYEVAADSFGNLYLSDNDDDGNASCRTLWCMPGSNNGYFSADGSRYWSADRRPGQETVSAHWHQEDPGVVPAGAINGAGGPTGVAVYESGLLSPWLEGRVLNADAGAGVVYAHVPDRSGSGVTLGHGSLIRPKADATGKRAEWFRPSDVAVGTDGAVYVADWFDPGVGGHQARDTEAYGRILRIVPAGTNPRPPVIETETLPGALAALSSPAVNVRAMGRSALLAEGAFADDGAGQGSTGSRVELGLAALAGSRNPVVAARALWLLAQLGLPIEMMLLDDGVLLDLRITALRALLGQVEDPLALVALLVDDDSAALRREAALALADAPVERALPLWLALAQAYSAGDRYALTALGVGARDKQSLLYEQLVAERGQRPLLWSAEVADLVWLLHPPEAVAALSTRAAHAGLSADARRQAVESLAFISARPAAEAMVDLALGRDEEVAALARWWVEQRDGNDWRAYHLLSQVSTDGLSAADRLYASEVVSSGLRSVEVDVTGRSMLWLVATDAGNGNSCDWANWIDPVFDTPRGEIALTDLTLARSEAQWGSVHVNSNARGQPLSIGGVIHARGLGTHAHSEIAVAVPDGATRFRCHVGPDDGGAAQPSSPTSIVFELWAESPPDYSKMAALLALVDDDRADPYERELAAEELAGHPQWALGLVQRAQAGELDAGLVELVTEAIFRNPDLGVRALAESVFERVGADGRSLPRVSELAALRGDAAAGARVYRSEAAGCLKCHSFAGLGESIGPDLTTIAEKYKTEALLDAIVNPSAAIAFGYDTWLFKLADGRLLSGFLLAEGATLIVKDTQGLRHVLAADEVVERRKLTLSTMPEGVSSGLQPQELADLAAFLLDDAERPPVFGDEVVLFDGSGLEAWTHFLSDDQADPANTWSIRADVLRCEGRPIGYLRTLERFTNFELTLQWRFDPEQGPGNSGVLLRVVGQDEVWPQSIEAQLGHRNAGDIWNIDKFPMLVDEGRTKGRRTIKLQPTNERPLGEWNHYRIRMYRGALSLAVNGELQNTASWCDETAGYIGLQSEGAVIEFRDIRLRRIVD
jgi:putative membrane-bound dehydrogenase-like protein